MGIFAWVDSWHSHGSLIKRYGLRIIYDAASHINCKVGDLISNGRWVFPRPVSNDLTRVMQDLPDFDIDRTDIVEWLPSPNIQFLCSQC